MSKEEKRQQEKLQEKQLVELQSEDKKDKKDEKDEKEDKERLYEDIQGEYDKLKDDYLRLLAEFDNYRKRVEKDMVEVKEAAKRSLINDFLTILDNLEKAIDVAYRHKDAIIEGIELSIKSFRDMLKRHGVEEINPKNESFNPSLHDALMMQESEELPKDTVIQTVQKGYKYKDKLIRPAKVIVSAGKREEDNKSTEKEE